jgi:hypothetical protein
MQSSTRNIPDLESLDHLLSKIAFVRLLHMCFHWFWAWLKLSTLSLTLIVRKSLSRSVPQPQTQRFHRRATILAADHLVEIGLL